MTPSRMLLATTALALALPLSGGIAAAADGDCRPLSVARPEVTLCEDTGYLDGGIGNQDGGVAVVDEAPAAGTAREDGGFYANVVAGSTFVSNTDPRFQPTITGSHTGTLDTLEARLYTTNPVDGGLGANLNARVRLTLDGRVLYDSYASEASEVQTEHLSEDLSLVSFRFTNLVAALERREMDNLADTEHTYVLELTEFYYGDGNGIFWYGSAEAPSAIVANLAAKSFATTYKLT